MSRKRPPDPERLWILYRASLLDRGCRPATIGGYQRVLSMWFRHLARQRPPVPWWQATPDELRAFLDAKGDPRSVKRRRGPRLSEGSRWSYHKVIARLYAWAADEGLIREDPLRRVARPRRPEPVARALELSQVGQLLDYLAGDDRAQVAVWLGYGLGLRREEIAKARISDVRLGSRPAMLVHGKGGRDRLVPLPEVVRQVLAAHLAGRPRSGPLLESLRRPDGLTAHSVGQLIARAMAAAGVDETAHSLRHTFATELLAADEGRNLRAVSRLLGHRSVVTTERFYTSSYDGDASAAAALLPDPRDPGRPSKNPSDVGQVSEYGQALEQASSLRQAQLTPEVAAWTTRLEQVDPGLCDQIRACVAEFEIHADAVAKAMRAASVLTTRFCSSFAKVHPDVMSMQADQDRERVEDAVGVMAMWRLADQLRDAHPDN